MYIHTIHSYKGIYYLEKLITFCALFKVSFSPSTRENFFLDILKKHSIKETMNNRRNEAKIYRGGESLP